MKKYNAYKDSGVKWIGEIPSHWKMVINGMLFHEEIRKPEIQDMPLSLSQKSGVVFADELDIKTLRTSSYENWKRVIENDLVLNRFKAHLGVLFASSLKGMVSFHYGVFAPRIKLLPKYYEYLFHTEKYKYKYAASSKGMTVGLQNLSNQDFYAVKSIFPPYEEQQAIVDYLKDKTLKIDQYVSARERERELLDSLKQSEIANVVTKGLNPNVKMKDSGIPWIGEIPEHWEVKKMRSIFRLAHEKTEKERTDLLSLSQYTGIRYKSQCDKTGMFEAESTVGYNIVHKGQFVMNIMLAWNGSYAVSDLEGIISPSYCIFDFKEDCDKRYFNYLLRTEMYQGEFKANSKGLIDSRLRLYPDYFFPIGVIVPPIEEQKAISDYIDSKLQKIDQYMSDLQREIDYLKEFKQRLISDAVTGQLCVTKQ